MIFLQAMEVLMNDLGPLTLEKLCRETQKTGLEQVWDHVCLYGLLPLKLLGPAPPTSLNQPPHILYTKAPTQKPTSQTRHGTGPSVPSSLPLLTSVLGVSREENID